MKMERENLSKKNLMIIFGGCSSEYEVSLQSAYSVIDHIDTECYVPVLIGITKEGDWYRYYGPITSIPENCWQEENCVRAMLSPNRTKPTLIELEDQTIRETRIDLAFPVLHGKNGEDGTVQGLIELAGIPLVGCNTLASALCMDKARAHEVAAQAGVSVPRSIQFDYQISEEVLMEKVNNLKLPLFIKPVKAGSSFGITKIEKWSELSLAVKNALQYDNQIIVEEAIEGFEVGCAVIGSRDLIFGEVDEIELGDGFFDYTEKYSLKTSKIHMPARIDQVTACRVKETAAKIYRALGCSGFARVDMFLTPDRELVFNEVNTIPGFTIHSRFPNMMQGAGMSFDDILDCLLKEA